MSTIDVELHSKLGSFTLDVTFRTPARGITALFGPSGAGKTTVLRCIAGLLRAEQGRVEIDRECWQDESRNHFVPTHRRSVGYVFQEASLFAHLRVRDNLTYGFKRVPQTERRLSLEQVAEWLGLNALLDRQPQHLSGGERQRVAIARALLTSPRLLLMDEPLSALDDQAKADILPYLERLHRELSIPALYVSHSVDDVTRLCDHVVFVERGTTRTQGTLESLLTQLDSPLAGNDAASAVIEATVVERDEPFQLSHLAFAGGRLVVIAPNAAIGTRLRVRIQARDVSLALARPEGSSILNILPARVLEVADDRPGRTTVRLSIENTVLLAHITRKSAVALNLRSGLLVYAQIKGVALLR